MNNKKAVISVGVLAVAVVVGFVALRGTWPPGQGTEGAIGAANRYSSTQITADDVKLQDGDIQAFIQSDLFHKIATNPEFRQMIQEHSFRDVASSAAYQAIVENKDQASSLANKEFAAYLTQPATLEMVTSAEFEKIASEVSMVEMLRSPTLYQLASELSGKTTTPAEFAKLYQNKEMSSSFVEMANKYPAEMMAVVKQPALLEGRELLIGLSGAAELLANPNLGQLLEAKAQPFAQLVTLDAHEEMMKNPTLLEMAFQSEQFRNIVEANQWDALEKGITAIQE
jgi:hypothetical protein